MDTQARRRQINSLRHRLFKKWGGGTWDNSMDSFLRLGIECPVARAMYMDDRAHCEISAAEYDTAERELRAALAAK